MTYQPQPGDVGLSGVKAQGVVSLAIRLGSVLRHEKAAGTISRALFLIIPGVALVGAGVLDLPWWSLILTAIVGLVLAVPVIVIVAAVYGFRARDKQWFSHSFIVHHVSDTGVWITESHARGVEMRPLHYAPGEFVWLKTSVLLSGDDEVEMRAFLDAVTAARWKYDYWTFAGLAIYSICGAMFVPPSVGTAICSGLTSEALTRGRAIWPLPAYRQMPQDQFWFCVREGIEIVETG